METAEDAHDRVALRDFRERLMSGEEELVPAEVANRIVDGENKIRVWREHRGMSGRALARSAKISPAYLSEIESNRKPGSVSAIKAIATTLKVAMEDLT